MFWTDANQAQERLTGSVVCYNKRPVYIDAVDPAASTCVVTGLVTGKRKAVALDDEKWNNFRDLPKLGWFNLVVEDERVVPVLQERRAINSRVHGLSTNNTFTSRLSAASGLERDRYGNILEYMKNPGYHETMNDEEAFPKLSQILMALDETPSGVAFSSKFCVVVTQEGMKWLYRGNQRIGFFTGTDSLNLFPRNGFYKEELEACPSFDINNVREF